MLIHVKLDYDKIKHLCLHNLFDSSEVEFTNTVQIRELDPFIRDLSPDSFWEASDDTVEINVSGELFQTILDYFTKTKSHD